jgi:hypothetical protein
VALEVYEGGADGGDAAHIGGGFGQGAVFQVEALGEFGGVAFVDTVADVFGEDEIREGLEFGVVGSEGGFGVVGALLAGEGREGEGNVGEDSVEVGFFGVDHAFDFVALFAAVAFVVF